jgi:hypothetical protein
MRRFPAGGGLGDGEGADALVFSGVACEAGWAEGGNNGSLSIIVWNIVSGTW